MGAASLPERIQPDPPTVYELLFRSRWYALAWALFMAASAILFTTTGAGAWLTSEQPDASATRMARESEFSSWAEDDKRRMNDETGFDPSSPEHVRDGLPPRRDTEVTGGQAVPFTNPETDEIPESGPAGQ